MQTQIEEYRDKARLARDLSTPEGVAAMRQLEAEKHHPTKKLMAYLRAAGRPRPSAVHSANHVVSGKGRYQEMRDARLHLRSFGGIGINDPDNGAWMPKNRRYVPHWSNPDCCAHSKIHTQRYEDWVYSRVQLGFDEGAIRTQLQIMGRQLETGTQPQHIIKPDNPDKR